MARNKKSIVGAVAGSVTDAVSTTIDALAHPVRHAREVIASAKRRVAARKGGLKRSVRKVARKAKREAAAGKGTVRKAVRKAAKRARRR